MNRHDAILRSAVERHRGRVFKTVGDGCFAVFEEAHDAVAAALAAQRELQSEPSFEPVGGVRVRMALHGGPVEERAGDYFGAVLNLTARLLSAAHGGQVLASNATAAAVRDDVPRGANVRDLGEYHLKDIARTERVFQVTAPGVRAAFGALRAVALAKTNVPFPATRLVGREREVDDLIVLAGTTRLVTVAGPGGVGKTRTALEAATSSAGAFADGVWLLELAPLLDVRAAETALCTLFDVTPASGDDPVAEAIAALRGRRALLVFDNCEHMIDGVASLVHRLLAAAPHVTVLATSRQRLGLAGEVEYRLAPLALPPPGATLRAEDATAFGAVELFVERARAANRTFTLGDAEAPVVAEIVRLLDGIPLAIALAAARLSVFGLAQLRERLGERFRVLTGGDRTALPRQQTLRATIDWSYDLLSPVERAVLRRAAAFAGSWTLEAAEAVCGFDGVQPGDVLEAVSALVDKSLVLAELEGGHGRYRLLESTRDYATQAAEEAGDLERARDRHAEWVAEYVDAARRRYWSAGMQAHLRSLRAELANARAALDHCARRPELPAHVAARIASGFQALWDLGGLHAEGVRAVEQAMARVEAIDDPAVAGALWGTRAALSHGEVAVAAAERGTAHLEAHGDPLLLAASLMRLASAKWMAGDAPGADVAARRALALYEGEASTPPTAYAAAIAFSATIVCALGRSAESIPLIEDAIRRFEALGERGRVAACLSDLAESWCDVGDLTRAAACARRAAAMLEPEGDPEVLVHVLCNLSGYLARAGDAEGARDAVRRALSTAQAERVSPLAQHLSLFSAAVVGSTAGDLRSAARVAAYVDLWLRRSSVAFYNVGADSRDRMWTRFAECIDAAELAAIVSAAESATAAEAMADAESALAERADT